MSPRCELHMRDMTDEDRETSVNERFDNDESRFNRNNVQRIDLAVARVVDAGRTWYCFTHERETD